MNKKIISSTRLAKICGVSQGTVDRALNNRPGINSKTKEKILKVAKEYGYRPNIHASIMAGGKSHLIGIVAFDLNNQYFSDIIMNIEEICNSQGYSTVVTFTNKDPKKEIECIQNLYHMSVDGIVLCPSTSGDEYENFLNSLNIPIVTFGNKLSNIPYVGIDNALAINDALKGVFEKEYEKIIYVKPKLNQKNIFAQKERLDSFVQICEKANISYVVTEFSEVEQELTTDKRCAIVCPTDIYAIKFFALAQKYNAGIIGFDNIRLIDELSLNLDSVAYDVPLTAKNIVDYIVNGELVNDFIPHQIIKRGSI